MRRILSVAVVLVAAVLLLGNGGGLVHAQSSGLGITPRRDLTVEPGKSTTDQVTVTNLSKTEKLSLTLQVIDFAAKNETGTPALTLDPEAPQTAWSLRPFLKAPSTLEVEPGKSENVKYTVSIPASQGAGSYYSAIRYVAQSGQGAGNVAISASGASLVFVTVPGKTKESLALKQFGTYEVKKGQEEGSYKSLFVGTEPKELAFTVKNQGNVAEQPTGSILIKNMFGKQVKIIKNANSKNSLALIDQTRRFQECINPQKQGDKSTSEIVCANAGFAPGRYTATLNVFYGINGNQTQEILTTATFWYLPVWFIAVMAVILLAVIGGAYMIYRRFTGKGGFRRR